MIRLSERFALRAALISVGTAVGAVLVVAAVVLLGFLAQGAREARATAQVTGEIKAIDRFEWGTLAHVYWTDEDGDETRTGVLLDEPGRWREGQPFRLRYDPREGEDANLGPYAVEPERTNIVSMEEGTRVQDTPSVLDRVWPVLAAGAAAALVILAWVARWRLNVATARRPGVPMRVHRLYGTFNQGRSAMVVLSPPELDVDGRALAGGQVPPGTRWQRVMWSPELLAIEQGAVVRAHIREGFGARAVLEPEDGVFVWPAGRLRRKGYFGASHMLAPNGTGRRPLVHPHWPPPVYWLVPIPAGVLGAVRGDFLVSAPLLVLGALMLTIFLWAWTGAVHRGHY
ncbi:hypothetical protein ABGB17_29640 [Sphaerisporangium sp. B11E5]|uniref:hypothetical protein n=1 Tax=Sphaerisporangium sp. B11E5 TaxID=3153563 RepID=UPI00325CB5BA